MYKKEYIPAQAVDSNFRMADLQGRWKNSFGSPEVEVVRSGHGYRITYSYKTGVSITTRLFRYGGTVFLTCTVGLPFTTTRCGMCLPFRPKGTITGWRINPLRRVSSPLSMKQ